MTYTGTIHGNTIRFEERLPFQEGLHVEVNIVSTFPRKGSPQAWLELFAGSASADEAALVLAGAQRCRQIDGATI
ncbi:hypothetical protein U14_05675 [Candidatus Moduliflexus flocculans]|uniref:Uncharacterized protein n=1 Tax=Candidatus Moduliflexus flocculans TaxID=1499966 RepID=A0A081BSK9_9BACT|nr:hypothetical protein U14_05675 [Candidatus Moduliflexus flocculans]